MSHFTRLRAFVVAIPVLNLTPGPDLPKVPLFFLTSLPQFVVASHGAVGWQMTTLGLRVGLPRST